MTTIHSDDFGYKYCTDKKIIQLVKFGKLKSLSIISNMIYHKSLSQLKRTIKRKRGIKLGLHLNVSDGLSLSGKKYIPTLVDKKNKFFDLPFFYLRLILKLIDERHIEKELYRQINHLEEKGLKVTFLDSHNHIHALSPVAEIIEKIAREKKIPHVRAYKNVKTYTFAAKMKYQILKFFSLISHLVYTGEFDLPVSWKRDSGVSYSYMSWEGGSFDATKKRSGVLVLVAHPYLPFDSNKSYRQLLV